MVFLGDDRMDPDKPTLQSKLGLIPGIQTGSVLQIKNRLYEITRMREKTRSEKNISLTTQFIYVKPISPQRLLTKVRDVINT